MVGVHRNSSPFNTKPNRMKKVTRVARACNGKRADKHKTWTEAVFRGVLATMIAHYGGPLSLSLPVRV